MSISTMISIHNCRTMKASVHDGKEYDFCTIQLEVEPKGGYEKGTGSLTLFFEYKMKDKMERIRDAINDIMNDVRCEDKVEAADEPKSEIEEDVMPF